jgi:hypothetical protein
MRSVSRIRLIALLVAGFTPLLLGADLTTTLIQSTYKIEGPAKQPGKSAAGTVFILQSPISNSGLSYNVLVTAKHVLDDIEGPSATVFLTFKQPDI